MPTLADAILLAAEQHRHQVDKAGQPYVVHPLRVMLALDTEPERLAGVLHDIIEDTDVTLDDLRVAGYPDEVLQALDCLTKREGETYEQFVERAGANPIARRVKLADLEDNLDLRRLSALSDRDVERLRRYLAAWQRLRADLTP